MCNKRKAEIEGMIALSVFHDKILSKDPELAYSEEISKLIRPTVTDDQVLIRVRDEESDKEYTLVEFKRPVRTFSEPKVSSDLVNYVLRLNLNNQVTEEELTDTEEPIVNELKANSVHENVLRTINSEKSIKEELLKRVIYNEEEWDRFNTSIVLGILLGIQGISMHEGEHKLEVFTQGLLESMEKVGSPDQKPLLVNRVDDDPLQLYFSSLSIDRSTGDGGPSTVRVNAKYLIGPDLKEEAVTELFILSYSKKMEEFCYLSFMPEIRKILGV